MAKNECRDFRQETIDYIKENLVDAEPNKDGFTDFFRNIFSFNKNLDSDLDNFDKYMGRICEINDVTSSELDKIVTNVHAVEGTYDAKFSGFFGGLTCCRSLLDTLLTEISKGDFETSFDKSIIYTFWDNAKALEELRIKMEGLTDEELFNLDISEFSDEELAVYMRELFNRVNMEDDSGILKIQEIIGDRIDPDKLQQYIDDYFLEEARRMARSLGIDYQEFIKTMEYQYGFDEKLSRIYLELYVSVANSDEMRGKSNSEIACEFNRIIASLCTNYDGEAGRRWNWTTGNYGSVDAYQMLMDKYGLSPSEAIDFTIAINVQHGNSCEYIEDYFGFSRMDGNIFTEEIPTVDKFKERAKAAGATIMKDFVHEAIQYVEFNDKLDAVDVASGSTDRMISYSGDIMSGRYEDYQDFVSDIDANNVQNRFENSGDNFLKVQQEYNKGTMDGTINAKQEFITNNGGINQIRANIVYDICSQMGSYMDGGKWGLITDFLISGSPTDIRAGEERLEKYKSNVDEFIDFLQS